MDGLSMCRWWSLVVVFMFEWYGRVDAPIKPTSVRCPSMSQSDRPYLLEMS
jgi:hypothetical protein